MPGSVKSPRDSSLGLGTAMANQRRRKLAKGVTKGKPPNNKLNNARNELNPRKQFEFSCQMFFTSILMHYLLSKKMNSAAALIDNTQKAIF